MIRRESDRFDIYLFIWNFQESKNAEKFPVGRGGIERICHVFKIVGNPMTSAGNSISGS